MYLHTVKWFQELLSKVGDLSRGWPEGLLFDSYYTEVLERALLFSLDCSTLPLIPSLYYWVLSKGASSTIIKVFGMTRPGDWTSVSRTIGKHYIYIYIYMLDSYIWSETEMTGVYTILCKTFYSYISVYLSMFWYDIYPICRIWPLHTRANAHTHIHTHTLPLIPTLYCWVLNMEALSTILWVFGMTRPGIEPRSPGSLLNSLTIMPMSLLFNTNNNI